MRKSFKKLPCFYNPSLYSFFYDGEWVGDGSVLLHPGEIKINTEQWYNLIQLRKPIITLNNEKITLENRMVYVQCCGPVTWYPNKDLMLVKRTRILINNCFICYYNNEFYQLARFFAKENKLYCKVLCGKKPIKKSNVLQECTNTPSLSTISG